MLTRFLSDRRGSVAPIFAIAAIPLLAATGAAVDYSRAYQLRSSTQNALDSAALAANRLVGVKTTSEIQAEANLFFKTNTAAFLKKPPTVLAKIDSSGVELTARLEVPTNILGVVGMDAIVFDLLSKTVAGAATYEVALVLDNSTSMDGSKISTLRTAAKDLVKTLFDVNASNPLPDPVKIAVVPFGASVNVGSGYANASWMDTTGASSIDDEDLENSTKSRFTLIDELRSTSWKGCVQTRNSPYDVTDDVPTSAKPDTLFSPLFAPDEPDDDYSNSYLDDYGGTCPAKCPSGKSASWCSNRGYSPPNMTDAQLQARTCKYKNETPSGGSGPNANCTTAALLPLTKTKSTIDSKIGGLDANGYTNIHSGVMWGWRVLSPSEPFTEGRAYDAKDNRKIMVLMTDGANTYVSKSNFNKSTYSAFGYVRHNHLGTTSTDNDKVVDKMNSKTLEACANAKATNRITIYTVAFQVNDKDTLEMLSTCASKTSMAFVSSSNSDLLNAFKEIAQDISSLRLAK